MDHTILIEIQKSQKKPKKNPWETDSEEDDDISDFSGVSDEEESDDDFRPVTKKAKSNGASAKLALGLPS